MENDERQLFGKLFSELRDLDQRRCEVFSEFLNELGKPIMEATPAKQPTLAEIESLKSTEKTSSKGPYNLITKAENPNNPVFEMLQSYIKNHNGFVTLHDSKLWLFSTDPSKIGYRKQ